MKNNQSGFSGVGIVLAVLVIVVIAATGALVYQRHEHKPAPATNSARSNSQQDKTVALTHNQTQTDPYAGWKTFTDNASTNTSGISIKYPSDWQVSTTSTKTYAWSIAQTGNANNIITVSYVFQNGTQTAQQEWEACEGTDSCGGTANDKTLSGRESTINGLNAYTASVQNSYGTYNVAVVRGNKPTSQGTPYVEFMTYTSDQRALSIFDKIMASATFPN